MADVLDKYAQEIKAKYEKLSEMEGKTIPEILNILEEISEQSILRIMDNEETPKEERLFWVKAEVASATEMQIAKLIFC